MNNGSPFSDKMLYEMSVSEAYKLNGKIRGREYTTEKGEKYTVVDIQHDTQTGFDAMAVKDQAGNVMIVYGGTDMNNGNQDVMTDVQIAATYVNGLTPAQINQAKEFRNRVVAQNPGADITLTGHSLGGGLSNAVALESGDKAINFNPAPLPYDLATVYGNGASRMDIINYQTSNDPLMQASNAFGGYFPGQTKVFVGGKPGLLEQHNMVNVHFDSEGNLVDVNGNKVADIPNSNINSKNVYIDEMVRGIRQTIGGAFIGAGSVIAFLGGLALMMNPVTWIFGAALCIGSIIGFVAGMAVLVSGLLRVVESAISYAIEVGQKVADYLYKKATEAIEYVVNGLIDFGCKALLAIQTGYRILRDGAMAVAQTVGQVTSKMIAATYEKVQQMGRMIQQAGEFINQVVQEAVHAFIAFKERLFEMTYAFIRDAIRTLFDVGDIIALLGDAALQIMADIVTLNWDKIYVHVLEKIDHFQHDARRDFLTSSRGFNHELAEEIGDELRQLAKKLESFSRNVYKIADVFQETERTISGQIMRLGV